MKNSIRFVRVGLAVAALAASSAWSAPVKVEASRIVIVDCGAEIQQKELKTHLDLLTGRDVPVVKPNLLKKSQYGFFLGRKPVTKESGSLSDLEELDESEDAAATVREQMKDRAAAAAARSAPGLVEWEAKKEGLYVWGEIRRGMYHVLASQFDFEWPWMDKIWVRPQTKTVTIPEPKGSWRPPYALRSIRARQNETFELWSTRLTAGKDNPPPEGHAFTSWWFRFCDDHREFFGERPDGLRAPYGVPKHLVDNAMKIPKKKAEYIPMCPSCEGFAEAAVAEWKRNGAGGSINFCENDARPWEYCRCKACTALDGEPVTKFGGIEVGKDTWPGWRSDRYMVLARRIMERAKKINPKVRGGMYAYNISELPPQREKVPEDVVIGLVPTTYTKEFMQFYVDAWKKAGMKEFYYRPNIRYYWRMPFIPSGYEKYMFEVQDLFEKAGGCLGFNYDGNAASSYYEYIQCWYLLKHMYDPTKSFDYWTDRLCRCFGSAAPEVKEYLAFWRGKWDAEAVPRLHKFGFVGFNDRFYAKLTNMYKLEEWDSAAALLDKGLARQDLGKVERDLLQTLRDENEQSRLFFLAWTKPSKETVADLINFRRSHHRATIWGFEEKRFGGLMPKGVSAGGKPGSHYNMNEATDDHNVPVAPDSDNVDIKLDETI